MVSNPKEKEFFGLCAEGVQRASLPQSNSTLQLPLMKLKGVDYGRVNVNFSDPYAYCQTTNRDNTQWMDLF